jgi:hypothetical protein
VVPEDNKRLVKALLDKKIITPDQLTQTLARQRETRENLEKLTLEFVLTGFAGHNPSSQDHAFSYHLPG